jgi:hypothetical protein
VPKGTLPAADRAAANQQQKGLGNQQIALTGAGRSIWIESYRLEAFNYAEP